MTIEGTQGLGWFLRRTRDPIALGAFYEAALGLPRMRSWRTPENSACMLWAGDVAVVEINQLHDAAAAGPSGSHATPIFRSHDLASSIERANRAGAVFVRQDVQAGCDTALFRDPDGFSFGIEGIRDDPRWPSDQRAADYWEEGRAQLPGEIAISGAIQSISRIVHSANDVAKEATFLASLGFAECDSHVFDLGGHNAVVLQASEAVPEKPPARDHVTDCWIARVYGIDAWRERLTRAGGEIYQSLAFPGGDLDYALTPGNALIGWQQRKAYDPDIATTQMVEDLSARSRWMRRTKTRGTQ